MHIDKVTGRRTILWGTVAAAVIVLIVIAARPQPVEVDTSRVGRAELVVTVDHEGRTRVRDRFQVTAPVTGALRRVQLEPGDPVSAGETVVAEIEPVTPVPLDERSRQQSEAELAAARADLETARAERERAAASHRVAAAQWQRTRTLFAEGVVPAAERDRVQGEAEVAAESLRAAEAAVQAAADGVEVAQAALLDPSEIAGGKARVLRLHSPVDGVVLRRVHESATVVTAGEPIVEVADTSELEIISDYLSKDAVQIRPGMPVRIERWGGKEPLEGVVRTVEPHGFLKISALGVEEQRVWVISDITSPRKLWAHLGDGYRVETQVVLWGSDAVLQVPTAALFRASDGGWAVFTVSDGRASQQPVEIGQRNGLAAQVLSGLEQGATVVLYPPDSLEDGTRVRARR